MTFNSSAFEINQHMKKLCRLGPRVSGSDADRKAAQYGLQILESFGLEVKREGFDVSVFEEKDSRLRVFHPETRDLTCRAFLRSTSTSSEGVTGEIIWVGQGRREDYRDKNVLGKMVLLDHPRVFGTPHVVSCIDIAKEMGAVGFILSSRTPGHIVTSMGAHRFGTPIPAVAISVEDAIYIRENLRRGSVKARLTLETTLERGSAENIIGVLKGKDLPEEFIYLTAHTDTLHISEGANDNASGVAMLLETARALSKKNPKRSIAFVLFSGEEGGCIGSNYYVEKHEHELKNIKALLNFDAVSVGNKMTLMKGSIRYPYGKTPGKEIAPPEWLVNYITNIGRKLGYIVEKSSAKGLICGDDGSFLANGVPATFWLVSPNPFWHSERDTLPYCNYNCVKSLSDIAVRVAWELANIDKLRPS